MWRNSNSKKAKTNTDKNAPNSADKGIELLHEDETPNYLPPHLHDLYNNSIQNKNEGGKREIRKLLYDFQDVFSKDESDLGVTHLGEHKIETGDALPVKQRPRRTPMARVALEKLQAQGSIQPSTSPWASPWFSSEKTMVAFVHAWIIVKWICLLGQTHYPYLEQNTV